MLILWCQGRGLSQRLGMLKPGGWGHTLGMLISGRGAGSETDMAIWEMFILWGGWGSFGTDIGCVNVVGGRGPGAKFGDVNIWGSVWGVWDRYRVNIVGPGKGNGGLGDRHWGCLYGGVRDRNGYAHIMGMGVFWDRHWGC